MTNFIDRLTKEEMGDLLHELRFYPHGDGFRCGTNIYRQDGYKVYHTWDHDYSSSKDYDDERIYISDFDVKTYYDKERACKALWDFMFNKFGKEWADKAINYFTSKKAVAKVRLIETLVENAKTETQNVENNI